jgi:hypothetical protein
MLPSYDDIKSRIPEQPKWYDENGVPRYNDFHPNDVPNIYAEEALLLEISCQDCGERFLVAFQTAGMMDRLFNPKAKSLSERIDAYLKKDKATKEAEWFPFHYGDPPIHGCVGDTMNCNDHRIVEFWQKKDFEWVRNAKYEIAEGI